MKNTFYFDHDYNARNDEKILMLRSEFGAEGYGMFWMLVESMAEASHGQLNRVAIGGLTVGYGVPKDRLEKIIDYCITAGLFVEAEKSKFYAPRIKQHHAKIEALMIAGRKGAEIRWGSQKNRVAIATPMQRRGEESRGKDITYAARSETQTLYEAIGELCTKYGLENSVCLKSLDVLVERYVGKIHMKVELQHCVSWLLDKGLKNISTQRIGNWFKKAQEIQKREQLKSLEFKERIGSGGKINETSKEVFTISPSVKEKLYVK